MRSSMLRALPLLGPGSFVLTLSIVIVAAACGGSGTPTTPAQRAANRNPVIAAVNVEPTFGVAYLTTFTASAQASDPDGDPLTYTWVVTDSARGQVLSSAGSEIRSAFPMALYAATARLTVTDGRGGSATRDSVTFVNGSADNEWMATSSAFPGTALFYVRLQQDSVGGLAGQLLTSGGAFVGSVDSGRIEAQGSVMLRLRFNSGVAFTISGQMQRNGFQILGNFTNTTATLNGRPLNGLPVTLEID